MEGNQEKTNDYADYYGSLGRYGFLRERKKGSGRLHGAGSVREVDESE